MYQFSLVFSRDQQCIGRLEFIFKMFLIKSNINVLKVVAVFVSLNYGSDYGQVNHEIFSEDDLLATDSNFENEVVIPPPDFPSHLGNNV